MAEESSSDEKTEEPSTQRREEFRRQGQVAQSKELSSVLILFGTAVCLWFLGRFMLEQFVLIMDMSFKNFIITAAKSGDWKPAIQMMMERAALILAPIFGMAFVLSFCSSAFQIGFLYNEDALQFDLEKLNPITGLTRVFNWRSLIEGVKAVFKLIIIGVLSFYILRTDFVETTELQNLNPTELLFFISRIIFKLLMSVSLLMLVLTGFDYAFQRWQLEQKMRMSKQEVKEENKAREGDPLIKARIKRVQRELSKRRMMEDVKKAQVVITNPTHIAVALKYTNDLMAPQLVAKGMGVIAEKIKEIAKENGVPIVENKPLARTLFKTIKIGQVIPKELYQAVAKVLAYIFKQKGRKVI